MKTDIIQIPQVQILKGLPASGKTTYAKALVNEGWARVNRDDLRNMLWGGGFTRDKESLVVEVMQYNITRLLNHGFNVVVDNTNLDPRHIALTEEAADGYNISVVPFLTDVKTCKERNSNREDSVPDEVIQKMSDRWEWPPHD